MAIAAGKHPFPFRTRQLSPPAPMVLGGRPPGRVGRRRDLSSLEAPDFPGPLARQITAYTQPVNQKRTPRPRPQRSGVKPAASVKHSANPKWGKVARSGARLVVSKEREGVEYERDSNIEPPRVNDWVRVDGRSNEFEDDEPKRPRAKRSGSPPASASKSTRPREEPRELTPELAAKIRRGSPTPKDAERLVSTMKDAIFAYEAGRNYEAARLARKVANETQSIPEVSELAGLSDYRLGRWRDAARELQKHRTLAGSNEHIAVLMDCHRAMGHRRKVADLWEETRRDAPSADVLSEARIVAAGCLADSNDYKSAIELLSGDGGIKSLRNPSSRHIRQWYALGDLYERSGDIPRARDLFQRVFNADPQAYDVASRLGSLGTIPTTKKNRKKRSAPVSKNTREASRS